LVEIWIPPSRSKTAKNCQKNRRNFRGYVYKTNIQAICGLWGSICGLWDMWVMGYVGYGIVYKAKNG
jgi:hypothetical protein